MSANISKPMSKEHELHLASIKEAFIRAADAKYRRGQAQHGGALWLRPCWADLMEELVDAVFYAWSHKVQLSVIADLALKGAEDKTVAAAEARESCVRILQILQGMPGYEDKA